MNLNFLSLLSNSNFARVLLVADRPDWAYDSIAKALVKHNNDPSIEFDIEYIKNGKRRLRDIHKDYDLVFMMGWQLLASYKNGKIKRLNTFLDPKKTLTGVHSHHSWDDRKTLPNVNVIPPAKLVNFLNKFAGVNIISRRLYEIFLGAGLKNAACTLNGVDVSLFNINKYKSNKNHFKVGFSGNNKHDWRKGISEFIEPACAINNIQLKLAMPKKGHYIPLNQMHTFYNDLDAYICASSSEGFSLSVLEASACGCPIISTRVGGCEDLIIDGVNGFLVDRDVDSIKEKVIFLRDNVEVAKKMGLMNRQIVEQLWSWDVRKNAWLAFIKANLSL